MAPARRRGHLILVGPPHCRGHLYTQQYHPSHPHRYHPAGYSHHTGALPLRHQRHYHHHGLRTGNRVPGRQLQLSAALQSHTDGCQLPAGTAQQIPQPQALATATGTKSGIYNLIIAVVIAVVIVLAMKLVGSLLISALVVFPALSAMRVFKNFKSVTICSACISVVCTVVGLLASIVADTPVGSTIVAVDICSFIIFYAIGFVLGRVKKA